MKKKFPSGISAGMLIREPRKTVSLEIDAQKGEIVKEYHSFFWEYNNPYDKVPAPVIIFDKTKNK